MKAIEDSDFPLSPAFYVKKYFSFKIATLYKKKFFVHTIQQHKNINALVVCNIFVRSQIIFMNQRLYQMLNNYA